MRIICEHFFTPDDKFKIKEVIGTNSCFPFRDSKNVKRKLLRITKEIALLLEPLNPSISCGRFKAIALHLIMKATSIKQGIIRTLLQAKLILEK